MALVNCPECGKQCSSLANSCPNCGAPIFAMFDVMATSVHLSIVRNKRQFGSVLCAYVELDGTGLGRIEKEGEGLECMVKPGQHEIAVHTLASTKGTFASLIGGWRDIAINKQIINIPSSTKTVTVEINEQFAKFFRSGNSDDLVIGNVRMT